MIGTLLLTMNSAKNDNINIFYIFCGVESFVLSFIVVFLALSRFNKQTFIDTFDTNKERVIFLVSLVVLSCTLCYSISLITKRLYLSNNSSSSNEENEPIKYSAKLEVIESINLDSGDYE